MQHSSSGSSFLGTMNWYSDPMSCTHDMLQKPDSWIDDATFNGKIISIFSSVDRDLSGWNQPVDNCKEQLEHELQGTP